MHGFTNIGPTVPLQLQQYELDPFSVYVYVYAYAYAYAYACHSRYRNLTSIPMGTFGSKYLNERATLGEAWAARFSGGLSFLHNNALVIHRNLTPESICITPQVSYISLCIILYVATETPFPLHCQVTSLVRTYTYTYIHALHT